MAQRLRTALGLFEPGIAMKRAQLRRSHPEASDEEVTLLLKNWMRSRPGAPYGDAEGVPTLLTAIH